MLTNADVIQNKTKGDNRTRWSAALSKGFEAVISAARIDRIRRQSLSSHLFSDVLLSFPVLSPSLPSPSLLIPPNLASTLHSSCSPHLLQILGHYWMTQSHWMLHVNSSTEINTKATHLVSIHSSRVFKGFLNIWKQLCPLQTLW